MFTGIVQDVGVVRGAQPLDQGVRLVVASERLRGLQPGESVAIDGVCQTIVASHDAEFTVEAIATTLARTTLGTLGPGRRVNLERALALGERLGGHLVQGHVDAVGRIEDIERQQEHVLLSVSLPVEVLEVTVPHGSIAINGVSLTVHALPRPGVAELALIPYTWEHTNLSQLAPGAAVNVEGDLIGKFVVQYLKQSGWRGGSSG